MPFATNNQSELSSLSGGVFQKLLKLVFCHTQAGRVSKDGFITRNDPIDKAGTPNREAK